MRNIADACRYIVAGPAASYQQFGSGLYSVALKETAVPIGICGLAKRESMKDIEIGFAFSGTLLGEGICVRVGGSSDGLRANVTGAEANCGDDRSGESRLDPGAGKAGAAI